MPNQLEPPRSAQTGDPDVRSLPPSTAPTPEALRAAFWELHADRLHGFALLLTLGDRAASPALASEAISAAGSRLSELRHPERAAAWLRARVVRRSRTSAPGRGPLNDPRRRDALAALGATPGTQAGLAALDRLERAALVADTIEGFDRLDTAGIVGRQGERLVDLLRSARSRYAAAAAVAAEREPEVHSGGISEQLAAIAARALQ